MDVTSYLLGKGQGGVQPTGEIDITANGVYNVGGYATADVQVPEANLQSKTQTISTNTTTTIQADEGYDGLSSVEVTTNIPQPSGTINITTNGTHDVTNYASANVSVENSYDLKTIAGVNAEITKIAKSVDDYYEGLPLTYNTLTTDNITLYKPYETYNYYVIFKKNNLYIGSWWPSIGKVIYKEGTWLFRPSYQSGGSFSQTFQGVNLRYNYGYNSSHSETIGYNNIEDCINALKNNETTYSTKGDGTSGYTIQEVICSNCAIIDLSQNQPVIVDKISQNETIEVIPSE